MQKIRAKFVKPSEDKGGKPERNITIVADLPPGEGDLSNYYTKTDANNNTVTVHVLGRVG